MIRCWCRNWCFAFRIGRNDQRPGLLSRKSHPRHMGRACWCPDLLHVPKAEIWFYLQGSGSLCRKLPQFSDLKERGTASFLADRQSQLEKCFFFHAPGISSKRTREILAPSENTEYIRQHAPVTSLPTFRQFVPRPGPHLLLALSCPLACAWRYESALVSEFPLCC